MKHKILNGKQVQSHIIQMIQNNNFEQSVKGKHIVIIKGGHSPSTTLINLKAKACEKIGISVSKPVFLGATTADMIREIKHFNNDPNVLGILVQLPLDPGHNVQKILDAIDPKKDIDCSTSINAGKFYTHTGIFKPCTPLGVDILLKYYGYSLKGKSVLILGRSDLVGRPLAQLVLANDGFPTVLHSHISKNKLDIYLNQGFDFIISATGQHNLILTAPEYSVLINIGNSYKLNPTSGKWTTHGDISDQLNKDILSGNRSGTPILGGVGPMTIGGLLININNALSQYTKRVRMLSSQDFIE